MSGQVALSASMSMMLSIWLSWSCKFIFGAAWCMHTKQMMLTHMLSQASQLLTSASDPLFDAIKPGFEIPLGKSRHSLRALLFQGFFEARDES